MTGTVFNVQRYSIHDGPGIRTTAFLKGCPLSCTWCHNPEGLSAEPEILVVADRCVTCLACMDACPSPPPVSAPEGDGKDRALCVRCGACANACVPGARRLVGRQVSVSELVEELERDRPFYEESGGGVTFSGGEPLMQGEFTLACLGECRSRGLSTAVDTCGFADRALLREVAGSTDLFLYDLKVLDDAGHRELTGAPVEPILENLRELDAIGADVTIRFPLIPGITDERDNIEALGTFVRSLERIRQVHVLPYHKTASDKYARLGRSYDHGGMRADLGTVVQDVESILRDSGLEIFADGRTYD